jgi:hypothetical protein
MCLGCGWRGPMQETLDRVRAGEEDPACLEGRRADEPQSGVIRRM